MALFASTKTYSVLIPKDAENPIEKMKLVQEDRFNAFAAIFKMFWALYNTMWLCAALLFFAQSFLMYLRLNGILPITSLIVIELGFIAFIGFTANDWKKEEFLSRGYVFVDVVMAIDELQAKEKFLRSYVDEEYYRSSEIVA